MTDERHCEAHRAEAISALKGVYSIGCFGPTVLAAFSGRSYTASRRDDFLRELGVLPESLVLLKQVHSANLVLVKSGQKPLQTCQADGMLTASSGFALGILTADCVPVFFWDAEQKAAGIAHAGWRGIYQGIIPKMLQAMRQNFGTKSESLRIMLGPAIRKCCYEVGEEFHDFFPEFYEPLKAENGKKAGRMDLIAAVTGQIGAEGVASDQIFDAGICTGCRNQDFFSARHEKGTSERILSVIQIRE